MSNLETVAIENSSPMRVFICATSNSGQPNLPASRLGKLGFALSSKRGADPPLPAPTTANGLEAGGDIEAAITALLHIGRNGQYPVCSKDLARGACCQRSPLRAVLKPLTW